MIAASGLLAISARAIAPSGSRQAACLACSRATSPPPRRAVASASAQRARTNLRLLVQQRGALRDRLGEIAQPPLRQRGGEAEIGAVRVVGEDGGVLPRGAFRVDVAHIQGGEGGAGELEIPFRAVERRQPLGQFGAEVWVGGVVLPGGEEVLGGGVGVALRVGQPGERE